MACARSVGNQNRRIAGTARTHEHGNIVTGDIASAVDDFTHRSPTAGAQIERRAFCTIEQRAHRFDVGVRQIGHMDVIAHAGAIRGRVIVAEYREAFTFSNCHLEYEWDSMGFRNMNLPISPSGSPPAALK